MHGAAHEGATRKDVEVAKKQIELSENYG